MWDWLKAAEAIHVLLAILAAIGCFHFSLNALLVSGICALPRWGGLGPWPYLPRFHAA